jgi:hypothetical protein
MQHLGSGMINCHEQLAKDFNPLVRNLKPQAPAGGFELLKLYGLGFHAIHQNKLLRKNPR